MGINKGFSLLELLVVLLIMLLIMTTVAVNLASNDAVLQQAAAQDLASLLRHTRSMALLTQKETVVLFDINEQSYQRSDQKKIYHLPKSVQLSWQANKTPWFHEQNRIRFFCRWFFYWRTTAINTRNGIVANSCQCIDRSS